MFGLGLISALPQINSSRLNPGTVSLSLWALGAEWRSVDFEVGGVGVGGAVRCAEASCMRVRSVFGDLSCRSTHHIVAQSFCEC
jgi:hypothetical protein